MENGISESTSVIRAVAPGCPTSAVASECEGPPTPGPAEARAVEIVQSGMVPDGWLRLPGWM